MLQMRARAWAMRDGFADILRGMSVGEEAQDVPRDVTAQGSHTTMPEPRRADFVAPQGGGYDPDMATPARPTVIDAQDENAHDAGELAETNTDAASTATDDATPFVPDGGWVKFAKFSEFEEFSTDFLAKAKPAQALAQTLQHYMTKGSAPQKEAVATLMKAYGELTREPAQ